MRGTVGAHPSKVEVRGEVGGAGGRGVTKNTKVKRRV